jgi:hypothetical protein
MAHPYGSGDEGPWGERWREPRRERGGEERFGSEREDRDFERRWAEQQSERRYGSEPGWHGQYGRDLGPYERGEWSEPAGYGEPRWYGRDDRYRRGWEDEEEGGRARRPRRGYGRWATSESGRRWPGGVTGAEAGQPYGGGFFGTAYALYSGRMERGESERGRMGRGPKGYRRSDERIHEDVCERIARAGVDADDVEVKVENGEVTLTGSVHRRDEKRWLEDLADDVWGVHEVHNHLRVARGEESTQAQGQQGQTTWPARH